MQEPSHRVIVLLRGADPLRPPRDATGPRRGPSCYIQAQPCPSCLAVRQRCFLFLECCLCTHMSML